MKLAIVVQRYGKNIVGGAEKHARLIAQKLHEYHGWDIHIYTSRAKDYHSWKNYYPPGESQDGKIRVKRFSSVFPSNRILFGIYKRISSPLLRYAATNKLPQAFKYLTDILEALWFILQGPYCPSLLRELRLKQQDYHKVLFFTYLYYPSVYGIPMLKKKAIFIPEAHDEAPFYFSKIRKNFDTVNSLLVNSSKEQELICMLSPQTKYRMKIAGIGLDQKKIDFKKPKLTSLYSIQNPYLLFMGRIGKGKGIDILIRYFLSWKQDNESKLELVLTGPFENNMQIPKHPCIRYLGYVNELSKQRLIEKSRAIVNPSCHESLSILVLEAMAAQKPVIINGKDPVLLSYTKKVNSVFAYNNSAEFCQCLAYLESKKWQKSKTLNLEKAKEWVTNHYSWNKVMETYYHTVMD